MYCPNCGCKNAEGSAFCGNCGKNLNGKTTIDYPNTETNEKYNPWAIAGFVLSLVNIVLGEVIVPGVLGLIFSIMGYNQIKEKGGKGKGLAIAGIIISAISLALYILIIITVIGFTACVGCYYVI